MSEAGRLTGTRLQPQVVGWTDTTPPTFRLVGIGARPVAQVAVAVVSSAQYLWSENVERIVQCR